ncbi:MAG TPA: uroporphyrinogen-III synthase [Bacillota bacterium]|nr:uroporphyrinogen-III synthase [Bacillota bacterium]
MSRGLEEKRMIVTASRKTEEMVTLVEKQGGACLVRPMQGTVFLAEKEMELQIQRLVEVGADWFIFTTGMGLDTLLQIAEKIEMKERFLDRLREAKVAYRGYKTYAALKSLGITPVIADNDGTTRGLVKALEAYPFGQQRVVVQLHGDAAPQLTEFLQRSGAEVIELLPYRHIAPDQEIAEKLLQEITQGLVDAVCFTTALQVQNLFSYAREKNKQLELVQAFVEQVLAVAVGKITAEAIEAEGIERILVPEHERMGAMIIALSQYMDK